MTTIWEKNLLIFEKIDTKVIKMKDIETIRIANKVFTDCSDTDCSDYDRN